MLSWKRLVLPLLPIALLGAVNCVAGGPEVAPDEQSQGDSASAPRESAEPVTWESPRDTAYQTVLKPVLAFDHRTHTGLGGYLQRKLGLEATDSAICVECHQLAEDGAQSLFPAMETCQRSGCHVAADREDPKASRDKCGFCHTSNDPSSFSVALAEVRVPIRSRRFRHQQHSADCGECHRPEKTAVGMSASVRPGRFPFLGETLCGDCHGQIQFPHSLHVQDEGLACETCHLPIAEIAEEQEEVPREAGSRQSYPGHTECVECHVQANQATPDDACAKCHRKDRIVLRANRAERVRSKGDIKFSHRDHENYDCSLCHKDARRSEYSSDNLAPGMPVCRDCHFGQVSRDGKSAPGECSACHAKITTGSVPTSHKPYDRPLDHTSRFTRDHKRAARGQAFYCRECHESQDCRDCHQTWKPRDHTPRYKRFAHGRDAARDKRRCATCHEASYCDECHQAMPPADHRNTPEWRGRGHQVTARRKNKGCFVCHDFADKCAQCHP